MTFRPDIQILRGVAVLLVVLYHLGAPGLGNGYLGVDAFFVISGFLMAKLYDQGSALDFYRRRVDRLLAPYVATILATLAVAALIVVPPDFRQLALQAGASALGAPNLYFWFQNSYFTPVNFNPLLNLWSLGVEAQFYLVVPLLYPLIRRWRWLFALVFVSSLASCALALHISPKHAFFLTPFRVWEFLFGALAAWRAAPQGREGQGLTAFGLLLALILLGPVDPFSHRSVAGHPGLAAFGVCALTALCLWRGLPRAVEQSAPGRALARLGDWSYSIYLVHFPLLVLLNYAPFEGTRLHPVSGAMLAAALAGMIALGLAAYHGLERRRFFPGPGALPRALPLAALLLALPPLSALNARHGDPAAQRIFAAMEDRAPFRCGRLIKLTDPGARTCPLNGATDGPVLLLVGNSHADALKMALAALWPGPVRFGVVNSDLLHDELPETETLRMAEDVGAAALLVHYSNVYDEPRFISRLTGLIAGAKARGLPVAVLAPIPVYPESAPRAAYQALRKGRAPGLSIPRAAHEAGLEGWRRFAASVASGDALLLDPASALCDATICRASDTQGAPYYFDDEHLTLTGAARLRPVLAQAVAAFSGATGSLAAR